jgi:hypothetical protein
MSEKNKQKNRDRVCERFLTAYASARYLCRHAGVADLANCLVPIFWDLQAAHERLVAREANRVLIRIVQSIRDKRVSAARAQELFELDGAALDMLLNHLDGQPKQDLASHLSKVRRGAKPKSTKKNI